MEIVSGVGFAQVLGRLEGREGAASASWRPAAQRLGPGCGVQSRLPTLP